MYDIILSCRLVRQRDSDIRGRGERVVAGIARVCVEIDVGGLVLLGDHVSSDAAVANSFDVAREPMERDAELRTVDEELEMHEERVCDVNEL